jgi:hypothetical protein
MPTMQVYVVIPDNDRQRGVPRITVRTTPVAARTRRCSPPSKGRNPTRGPRGLSHRALMIARLTD